MFRGSSLAPTTIALRALRIRRRNGCGRRRLRTSHAGGWAALVLFAALMDDEHFLSSESPQDCLVIEPPEQQGGAHRIPAGLHCAGMRTPRRWTRRPVERFPEWRRQRFGNNTGCDGVLSRALVSVMKNKKRKRGLKTGGIPAYLCSRALHDYATCRV